MLIRIILITYTNEIIQQFDTFDTVLEYLRVTSHGVYSKEEGWFLHEPLFIFSQINKTLPVSKGQDNSIYICNKFLKN